MEFEYQDDKFRELMLYIAQEMADDPAFGATVLNKVLFFADFFAYRFLGQPITGAVYQKLDYGPAPRRLLRELEQLTHEGRAVIHERKRGAGIQKRLVALDKPNLDLFSGTEIALVNEVINGLRGRGAVAVSTFSHRASVGWLAAEMHEDIPYGTVFLSPPIEPTPTQEKRAKELVAAHGSESKATSASPAIT